jgi:ABC-2 type transport system permease protein
MGAVWTIYRRELAGLFLGPLAWVLLCLALLVNGFYFTYYVSSTGGDVNTSLMLAQGGSVVFWGLMILIPPLLTMRMISEEARTGTLEFLLTAPVSDVAVVLGKLAAATSVLALLWGSSVVYALTLTALGSAPDWGPVVTGLIGAILISALFCGMGLVASAATDTPLIAAFLAFCANVALLSLPFLGGLIGMGPAHPLRAVLEHLDAAHHMQSSFLIGVLDSQHLAIFAVWIAFTVLLATRFLEMRRWAN